jgi:hypothetical protein
VVEDIGFPLGDASRQVASTLDVQCSARRCKAAAAFQLKWNNPRIHAPEARKTWLACVDHKDSLGDFLRARRFLREVEPFPGDPPGEEPGPARSVPLGDSA